MKKMITTLLATVIIMSVMGVTVAAVAASTKHATDLQQTKITITSYPKQVKVGEDFLIKGQLTSGGTGLGNKLIYFNEYNATYHMFLWDYNFTTNPDGSFTDHPYMYVDSNVGTMNYMYSFWGDNQYDQCGSDPFTITVTQ